MSALQIRDLRIDLATDDGPRPIVNGIDLVLEPGRIHGLAGESGSGKTMTALAVLGLLPTGMTASGSVILGDDTELLGASLLNAVLAALIVSWPAYARLTRGLVLGLRTSNYVVSGQLLGFSPLRSMSRQSERNGENPSSRPETT